MPRSLADKRVVHDAQGPFAAASPLLAVRPHPAPPALTYKHPPEHSEEGARYKVRVEHETEVLEAEETVRILTALGFHQVWRYQKHRQSYQLGDVRVELDELPFATFIEFEGEPAAIDAAARRLGFGADDYITATYRDLFCELRGSNDPGDMLFEDESA